MAFPDLSKLEYWETVAKCGFVAVIVGVAGEVTELISKWIEWCRKKEFSERVKTWFLASESFFFALVVIGLAVEFWGSQQVELIADAQNIRLSKLAADTALQAEGLRKENLLLEARIQPRRMTPEQRMLIIHKLQKELPQQRRRVDVEYEDFDIETRLFAMDIRQVLSAGGLDVKMSSFFESPTSEYGPIMGVFLHCNNPPPPGAEEIRDVFIEAGVFQTNTVFESGGEPGALTISVWPKPLQ